ncbi:hypothetical protein AB205_0207770 [Aquarana catesbeiana]|uniref:Neutral amino acid transporter 9 n=1 Tax=Aquarana catesbeiana TaxID=8400 RepID=A0A2G9RLM3_AQUCT|nr:hypothetical protein AB205_0207770 [Aquarana catesbeiana]
MHSMIHAVKPEDFSFLSDDAGACTHSRWMNRLRVPTSWDTWTVVRRKIATYSRGSSDAQGLLELSARVRNPGLCCQKSPGRAGIIQSNFIFQYIAQIKVYNVYFLCFSTVICPNNGDSTPLNETVDFVFGNTTGFTLFQMCWNKTNTVPLYLIIILLPLLNFRSPSFFAKFNVLEFRLSFPQLTGILTLAFFIHNCIITLLKNNKNPENNVRDLSVAYLLVGLTYMFVGVMVFGFFPSPPLAKECIQQNFLDNFPSNDILSFAARIFLLFQMMTVYPLLGYLVRVQLLGHIFGDTYPSILHVLALNIVVIAVGVVMAKFYPNIGGIIRFSGAACGLAFVFVYPCLIHMIALYRRQRLTWFSAVIHTSIIILGVGNLVAQFLM